MGSSIESREEGGSHADNGGSFYSSGTITDESNLYKLIRSRSTYRSPHPSAFPLRSLLSIPPRVHRRALFTCNNIMRAFIALLALISYASATILWARQAEPPECTIPCLNTNTNNISTGACGSEDLACLCRDSTYVQAVIDCLATVCLTSFTYLAVIL